VDVVAQEKMKDAEEIDKTNDERVTQALADIEDTKKQGGLFKKKIGQYNKPMILSILGVIICFALGLIYPVFGSVMIKAIWSMLKLNDTNYNTAVDAMSKWILLLGLFALYAFLMAFLRTWIFGVVAENVTENMRRDVYSSVLRKHMGWHDIKTNTSGAITALLAGECSQLQGLTSQALGVIFECVAAMGFAIAIGFYFSWPMALIALGLSPFLAIGGKISGKEGLKRNEAGKDEADVLAMDSISNFKTVASFGCDAMMVQKYTELMEKPFQDENASQAKYALGYGMGQLITNVVAGTMYYMSGVLAYHYPKFKPEDIWIALFTIMFGALSIGNATAFGPDVGKATQAAIKIFKVTDTPSSIDALDEAKST
jgi:ABC-type multidrug transport system fused ATPase/permease subunit